APGGAGAAEQLCFKATEWVEISDRDARAYWQPATGVTRVDVPPATRVAWRYVREPQSVIPHYVHVRTGALLRELPLRGDPASRLPEVARSAWVERQAYEGGRQWTYYFNLHTLDLVSHQLPAGHTTVRGPWEAPPPRLAPRLSEHVKSPGGRYLQVGAPVQLLDLCSGRHLNGQAANVLKLCGEKVIVQLPRELGGRMFAVPWGCARPLQEGAIVELRGLKENHEFNGRRGRGRWDLPGQSSS
ncbi:unnamed protein product, partial [Prorocentrum cordatum]